MTSVKIVFCAIDPPDNSFLNSFHPELSLTRLLVFLLLPLSYFFGFCLSAFVLAPSQQWHQPCINHCPLFSHLSYYCQATSLILVSLSHKSSHDGFQIKLSCCESSPNLQIHIASCLLDSFL